MSHITGPSVWVWLDTGLRFLNLPLKFSRNLCNLNQTAKALVELHICAVQPEPLLFCLSNKNPLCWYLLVLGQLYTFPKLMFINISTIVYWVPVLLVVTWLLVNNTQKKKLLRNTDDAVFFEIWKLNDWILLYKVPFFFFCPKRIL